MNQLEDAYKALMRFNVQPPNNLAAEIPNDETIVASLKGRMNEWLICTDKQIYILKSGLATGNVNRIGNFHLPYASITNAFVDFHVSTGYFEVLSGNMSHDKKTYWGSNKSNPQLSPNCIGIMNKKDAEKFEVACTYINAKSTSKKYAVKCPKCGADVGNASFCPQCGTKLLPQNGYRNQPIRLTSPENNSLPQKKEHHIGKIIGGTIGGIVAFALVVGVISTLTSQGNTSASPISSSSSSLSSTKSSSLPSSSKAITYQEQSNGKIAIKINSVGKKDSVSAGLLTEYQPKNGAKILVVNLRVKNISNEAYSFLVSNFQLYSADGKKYSPSTMLTAKNYLNAGSVNPGVSISGDVGFEIPEAMKASDFTLKFEDLISSDSAISIKLN